MTKWIYAQNNAYSLVAKIENGKAKVLTETKDFPDTWNSYYTIEELIKMIENFMTGVIENDDSDNWEEYEENDILESNEVIWEKIIDV